MRFERLCLNAATVMLLFVGFTTNYQLYQEGVRREDRKKLAKEIIRKNYSTNSPDDQEMATFLLTY